jgi:uncharacterized membrane protein
MPEGHNERGEGEAARSADESHGRQAAHADAGLGTNGDDGPRAVDTDARTDARVARLERVFAELSARLASVEQHLAAPRAQPQTEARPFNQGEGARPSPPRAARSQTARPQPDAGPPPPHAAPGGATAEAGEAGAAAAGARAREEEFPFGPRGAREREARAGEPGDFTRQFEEAWRAGEAEEQKAKRARADFETIVGGSLAKWLGIVAGVLGVGFFLKYAFESQWIGARGRVAAGAAVGLGLIALAERLRRRGYRSYPNVLTGGGILILYLSVYAARVFYELVGLAPAFALMAAVTAAAVLLSVRYDAIAIAVLALLGGFATPVLLSTGVDNQIGLFTYVFALDAGVLALAYFKRWRALNHISFWLTALTFAGWLARFYEPWKLGRTVFFLTLFFLVFSALAVVHNVLARRRARWADVSLIIPNATLYFAASYALLDGGGYGRALGTFALVVSSFYVVLFYVARTRHREDRLLALSYVGAAVTFFTLAVSIQLDLHWVTIGWAVEALMLVWVGLRAGERGARLAAAAVFALAGLHWLAVDAAEFAAYRAPEVFVPFANRRAASAAALVAALCGATWLYRREGRRAEKAERDVLSALYALAAAGLALVALSADVNDYYLRAMRLAAGGGGREEAARLDNTRLFALSALWTLYGAGLWAAGYARRVQFLRFAAFALLGVTALKLVALDASYFDAPWHRALANQTFAAFALFVFVLWYVARTYARAGAGVDEAERRGALTALTVVGNLLAVAALSLEAVGYFDKQIAAAAEAGGERLRDLRLAAQLSLSLVWAVYGGALLALGHARGNRVLRLMALALLGAATVKVFFFDLSELERFYRIVSFIALGAILLGVSFLYQQRQRAAGAEGD